MRYEPFWQRVKQKLRSRAIAEQKANWHWRMPPDQVNVSVASRAWRQKKKGHDSVKRAAAWRAIKFALAYSVPLRKYKQYDLAWFAKSLAVVRKKTITEIQRELNSNENKIEKCFSYWKWLREKRERLRRCGKTTYLLRSNFPLR